ncbi:MAG TPA: septum formation initiator family protein [Bryobacteraceae bacterium]|nr:septum formation initiator family protein [Bryobacteraceae bacterium]
MIRFFREVLRAGGSRGAWAVGIALLLAYGGWIALRGPQGFQALLEKRHEIRQLQDRNAALAHDNDLRRERIERLKDSPSEQEMQIRKLKLLKPGETTFILPDARGQGTGDRGPEKR